ncbi:MAG TPA: class II aldolase/adducin family protein [Acidimicrobiales bacterium]|nr:class II aldolase/adducin family protein [Acidimicrobiales bacterium]
MSVGLQEQGIDDDRPAGMSAQEWEHRAELAACYRIFDLLGWTEMIFNHISLRLPGDEPRLLINPFGLAYSEVTAANLVAIDFDGNTVEPEAWRVNSAGVLIHTAIHASRPDAHVVMHTHTTAGCAVAALEQALDPNNFYSAQLDGAIAYHEFEGISNDKDEQPRLVSSLGDHSLMILRNHGLLACGRTIPEAFFRLWTLERACEVQLAGGGAATHEITAEARARSSEVLRRLLSASDAGVLVYDALRRKLDASGASYRR